tara:strand:+ start:848 stop:1138 length:291 start_codon:yes stop_codon:yes gene_type:complete
MIADFKEWVKLTLINSPRCRDSNELLYYKYLKHIHYDVNTSAKQFLKDMSNRKIPYVDSIARASRKTQEDFPYLRGKYWGKRKKKSVKVKHEMLAK